MLLQYRPAKASINCTPFVSVIVMPSPWSMILGAGPVPCAWFFRWVDGWKTVRRSICSRLRPSGSSLVMVLLPFVTCMRLRRHADVLEFGEFLDPLAATLAAESGLLDAAEGNRRARDL